MSKTDTIQPYLGIDVTGDDFDRWLDDSRERLAVENWREIGASGNPAFQNSWANDVAGPTAAFYRDPFNIVRLRGAIDSGTSGTVAFTLPIGYRPSTTLYFPILQTAAAAGSYLEIQTDGDVIPYYTAAEVYLNNITFRV